MFSGFLLILVLIGLAIYLRRLRQREIDAFMQADLSQFDGLELGDMPELVNKYQLPVKSSPAPPVPDTDGKPGLSGTEPAREVSGPVVSLSPRLLDEPHIALYRNLSTLLGQQYYIAMRVPLTYLISTGVPVNDRLAGYDASCVICSRYKTEPILILQLDSSEREFSIDSSLITELLQQADIPFLRLAMDEPLGVTELKQKLGAYIDVEGGQKDCPKCGQKMVLRLVTKGTNAGRTFWVCPRFPECRGVAKFGTLNN